MFFMARLQHLALVEHRIVLLNLKNITGPILLRPAKGTFCNKEGRTCFNSVNIFGRISVLAHIIVLLLVIGRGKELHRDLRVPCLIT